MTSDARLMQALGFDEQDLQANRAGELTNAQRERVRAVYQQFLRGILPTLGIIGAIMVSAAVISQVRGAIFREQAPDLSLWLYLFVILALIVGGGSYWLTMGVRSRRIHVAEGTVSLKTGFYSAHRPYYHAKIGRHTFYLASQTEYEAFKEGEHYGVYYIPYWPDVILSAEQVETF